MGGKSKSATVGYWYEVAFHSGLGIGPFDAYLELRGGDKTAWRGEATHSQTIYINAPNLWGGEKDQGGIVGSVDLMFGEATQQPNSRLAGIFGPQQPAWRGFATLAFAGKYGAMNPYPQKASHKIRKIREGWDGECWYPGKAAIPMPTCAGGDPYIYATSLPYPSMLSDHAELGLTVTSGGLETLLYESPMQPTETGMGLAVTAGELFEVPPPEFNEDTELALALTGGQMFIPPPQYTYDATELGLSPSGGRIATPPIGTLDNDETNINLAPTGGSLYVP